jgi:serine/threonine protein kinase
MVPNPRINDLELGSPIELRTVKLAASSPPIKSANPSPPLTPPSSMHDPEPTHDLDNDGVIAYDFSKIDYELERAKVLGTGLWSTVYLSQPRTNITIDYASPPSTPSRRSLDISAPSLFAVKQPSRKDARHVFDQEARVLSRIQARENASQFLVPFYGLDPRNGNLVFEAVIGGSLENLAARLKQMTEVARHVELIATFPGIAVDLVNGLSFLHAEGVIHADIKSANVLLDMYEQYGQTRPVIRARYIDFSAAFMPAYGDSHANAGGTWEFLAPEQLRVAQPELSIPTKASDVWSLGLTLLAVVVGGSPYESACGGNVFMLREAIKVGDPIGFARMDPVARKRLLACQDFVDCCRLALKKDRENRVTAEGWAAWLEAQQLEL